MGVRFTSVARIERNTRIVSNGSRQYDGGGLDGVLLQRSNPVTRLKAALRKSICELHAAQPGIRESQPPVAVNESLLLGEITCGATYLRTDVHQPRSSKALAHNGAVDT